MPFIWSNSSVVILFDPSKRKTKSTAFCWHPGETGLGRVRKKLVIKSTASHRNANADADWLYFVMQVWWWVVRFSVRGPSCSRCHSDSGVEDLYCYSEPEHQTKAKSDPLRRIKRTWLSTSRKCCYVLTVNSKHMASSAVESPKRLTGIDVLIKGISVATYCDYLLVTLCYLEPVLP